MGTVQHSFGYHVGYWSLLLIEWMHTHTTYDASLPCSAAQHHIRSTRKTQEANPSYERVRKFKLRHSYTRNTNSIGCVGSRQSSHRRW